MLHAEGRKHRFSFLYTHTCTTKRAEHTNLVLFYYPQFLCYIISLYRGWAPCSSYFIGPTSLPSCYARFYTTSGSTSYRATWRNGDSSKTGQYKMQTADCRLQTGYKMQTRYEMQIADCRLGVKCRLTPKPSLSKTR